jgi:hypothetical protein
MISQRKPLPYAPGPTWHGGPGPIFLCTSNFFAALNLSINSVLMVISATMGSLADHPSYSPVEETERIFGLLCDQAEQLSLPASFADIKKNVVFKTDSDRVYFPIPFKETETASALKGVEGGVAGALAELKTGRHIGEIKVDLEKATSFLFQSYLATIGELGKLDDGVRAKLKGINVQTYHVSLDAEFSKIPIYSKHSQILIDGCRQISTRQKTQAGTIISMARSRPTLH